LDRPAGPKTVKEYSRIVAQKIGKIQRYPLLAKRRGITGKVVIEFTILKTGQLGKLKIIKSSHDILTKAAIAAIKESVPFPKFPKEINKESLALRMPFNYQM
jgi:periplasmic protein TonB